MGLSPVASLAIVIIIGVFAFLIFLSWNFNKKPSFSSGGNKVKVNRGLPRIIYNQEEYWIRKQDAIDEGRFEFLIENVDTSEMNERIVVNTNCYSIINKFGSELWIPKTSDEITSLINEVSRLNEELDHTAEKLTDLENNFDKKVKQFTDSLKEARRTNEEEPKKQPYRPK